MKKIKKMLALSLACLMLLFCGVACDDAATDDNETVYHTVTFDFQNGQELYSVQVADKAYIIPPVAPEREGYIFGGWKRNGAAWDFETEGAFRDLDFVAQWIDASSVFGYSVNEDGTATVTEYKGSLDEIRIPKVISGLSVSGIAPELFKDFEGVATVIALPESVVSVGASAFEGCDEQMLTVAGTLEYLGERAFDGCSTLASIALSDKLDKIPFRAFAGCSALEELKIPESVTVVCEDAFKDCSSVKTLIIGARELSVENSAFFNCTGLVTVFFEGSETEWQSIISKVDNGGGGNDALLEAKVYFYSESEAEGDFWYYNDKGEPRCW